MRCRAKPVEIALVNLSISAARYAFAIKVARKAARTSPPHVAMASSTSVSRRAAASASASGFFESSYAFTSGFPLCQHENKIRIQSQWVNVHGSQERRVDYHRH